MMAGRAVTMMLDRSVWLPPRLYWILPLLVLQIACGVVAAVTSWIVVLVPLFLALAVVSVLWLKAGIFVLAAAIFLRVDIPGRVGVYPADLIASLLLTGLLMHGISKQRLQSINPLVVPMIVVLGVFTLSLIGAHNSSAGALNLLRHVEMFGVIVLTAGVLDRKDVRKLLMLLLFVSIVMVIPNIVEAIRIGGRQRVFGAAGPYFPFFLSAVIIERTAWVLMNGGLWRGFLWVATVGLLGLGIVVSQTREAMLQTAIGITLVCIFVWLWSTKSGDFAPRRRVLAVICAGALVLAIFFSGTVGLFEAPSTRVSQALEGRSNSIFIRLFLWRTGIQAFTDSPLLGIGLGQIAEWDQFLPYWRFDPMSVFARGLGAHDDLITYAAETGLLGLGALFWLFLRLGRVGLAGWRQDTGRVYATTLVAVWSVCLSLQVRFFFGTHTFYSLGGLFNCLYFGMLIAYTAPSEEQGTRKLLHH